MQCSGPRTCREPWGYLRIGGRAAIKFSPKAGPDLKELLEMRLQAGGEGVHRGVAVVRPRRHHDVVRPEDVEVVPDRLVIQTKMSRDRVRVRGTLAEVPDDLRSVDTAPGACDQVPQPLVHHRPGPHTPRSGDWTTYCRTI